MPTMTAEEFDRHMAAERRFAADREAAAPDPAPETRIALIHDGAMDAADAVLPATERAFRDAWIAAGPVTITVDMDTARPLQREHLRRERAEWMPLLDIAWQRADELQGAARTASRTALRRLKESLRDAPAAAAVDAAADDTELAAVTLESILGADDWALLQTYRH